MGLKDSLKHDLTEAMRARDELVLSTIRLCLSAITNEEVSGKEARVLTEAEVIQVLSREAKKRRESAQAFADAKRPDRAERENAEGEVIARYLPTPLSESELASLIADAMKES
ncbi:MAG: GatB/YqeY domain-containing protein, partial [Actinobacteria bacterium]|nr:GatB/YqeY domain-containing protein [Actinomycetota bacterium]